MNRPESCKYHTNPTFQNNVNLIFPAIKQQMPKIAYYLPEIDLKILDRLFETGYKKDFSAV